MGAWVCNNIVIYLQYIVHQNLTESYTGPEYEPNSTGRTYQA